jgi:hypothetical protein
MFEICKRTLDIKGLLNLQREGDLTFLNTSNISKSVNGKQ